MLILMYRTKRSYIMSDAIYMPTKCIWGENSVSENSDALKTLGKKCLILTGKSGAKKSGALDDAISALGKENIPYEIFDEIGENPLMSVCHKAGIAAREAHSTNESSLTSLSK